MNVFLHFSMLLIKKKAQEMCDRFISDDPFPLRYVPD